MTRERFFKHIRKNYHKDSFLNGKLFDIDRMIDDLENKLYEMRRCREEIAKEIDKIRSRDER